MSRLIIVFTILLFPLVGLPQYTSSRPTTREGVTIELADRGIDPTQLSWNEIESTCRKSRFQYYNDCLIEKAVLYHSFKMNQEECDARARSSYPDKLLSERTESNIIQRKFPSDLSSMSISTTTYAPINKDQLKKLRRHAYFSCMTSLNWSSADDWKLGYRTISEE